MHSDRRWLQTTAGTKPPPTQPEATRPISVFLQGEDCHFQWIGRNPQTCTSIFRQHQQQTCALKLLPSLRNTDYVFDYFPFPRCCFARSNRFAAMFFINLDSRVGGLFQILFTLLPVLLLSFRFHVYRREQHFKWLWWIYVWVVLVPAFPTRWPTMHALVRFNLSLSISMEIIRLRLLFHIGEEERKMHRKPD